MSVFVRGAVVGLMLLAGGALLAARVDEPPVLEEGRLVLDGDAPLSVGHTASIEATDWNGDGKKDLLVGTFAGGKTLILLNRGTDAAPEFEGAVPIEAGGEILSVGSG